MINKNNIDNTIFGFPVVSYLNADSCKKCILKENKEKTGVYRVYLSVCFLT